MSEVQSLPQAHVVTFQLGFSKFASMAVRQKLQGHFEKSLPEDRVRPLTRQDILEYGRNKLIISEADTQKTYEQQLAQSAADRLFELLVAARKQKKEKLARLEEEVAAKTPEGQTPEKVETDRSVVD